MFSQRARRWPFKIMLGAFCASLSTAALVLTLSVWDNIQAARYWKNLPSGGKHFVRRGARFYCDRPELVDGSFPAEKSSRDFRVFVLGSSQAMGAPYVHQRFDHLAGGLGGLPNTGGISTWLERYLQLLLPERSVQVVNAAKGGGTLAASIETLREIAEVGRPDLIVILEGNNERDRTVIQDYEPPPGEPIEPILENLTAEFRKGTSEVAALAAEKSLSVYFLTVPNNLRDWIPLGDFEAFDAGKTLEDISTGEAGEVLARVLAVRSRYAQDPLRSYLAAKCHDKMGEYDKARALYVEAKDNDRAFLRTRSRWNKVIRSLRAPGVRVVDMEALLARHASDGILDRRLFHDYCHMTLQGNRLVAFELARSLRSDLGLAGRPLQLEDVPLKMTWQVRLLYRIKALKWYKAGKWAKAKYAAKQDIMNLNKALAAEQFLKRSRAP